MDSRRPKVAILGTRFRDLSVEREILGQVDLVSGPGTSREEIIEVAGGADVVLAGAAPRFDADTLKALHCRAIVRLGVGVDSVDIGTAHALGMWVINVPDYGTEAVALHTVALILASIRRLTDADRRTRQGIWGISALRPLHLPEALTVGIVGFGRIGRRVADMLAGVGFRNFLVTDPLAADHDVASVAGDARASLEGLSGLLAGSDVVTLHAPPPPEGYLLDADKLGAMRAGSVLINTARGALIDTDALVSGLGHGRPAFAALDVFETEPVPIDAVEPVLDRLILTPHMSWYTEETELAMRRQAADEARRVLAGEQPMNPLVSPSAAEVG